MVNILTVCRAGLIRSSALANVLKLHFSPVDVLPCGIGTYDTGRFNSEETLDMLFKWADKIVVMEEHYQWKIPDEFRKKVMVCEVGPDVYGSNTHPKLIDMVWRWTKENQDTLGIKEVKESR